MPDPNAINRSEYESSKQMNIDDEEDNHDEEIEKLGLFDEDDD